MRLSPSPNPSFARSFLSTVTLLALGQSAFAYEFTPPHAPSLPADLPENLTLIDSSTTANPASSSPGPKWDWYGPTNESTSNNDVHFSTIGEHHYIFGGWSKEESNVVSFNRVVIKNGAEIKNTYGGYSQNQNVERNIVEVFGKVHGEDSSVYGGASSTSGDALDNMVFVRNGGTVLGEIAGGEAQNGRAIGNVVVVAGNAVVAEGSINGGKGALEASNNSVFIYGQVGDSNQYHSVYGGHTTNDGGTSNGNMVYIGAGSFVDDQVFAAFAPRGTASENILVIEDAKVQGNAGAVDAFAKGVYTQGTGNELHLLGNAIVTGGAGAHFDGWQENATRGYDGLVHVRGTATVGSLSGFDHLVIELTDDNVQTAAITITNEHVVLYQQDPILDLKGVDILIDAEELSNPNQGARLLQVASESSDSLHLHLDEQTVFTDESSVFVDRTWKVDDAVVAEGGIEVDSVYIDSEGNIVSALNGTETILGERSINASTESNTLSESFLGTIAFVNQGAEFIADEGLRVMTTAAAPSKISTFGAVHGGSSRYETGSHVDVDGVTLATGAVTKVGNTTLAGFVEAGWASSESHVSGTEGDGDHDYYGFGAALRHTFENDFYLDASARFGWASTEFDGRYANANAQYDADGLYGSLHVGAGHVFTLNKTMDLDLYGRYVFTYLEGDSVRLETLERERFDMEDAVTHAFRIGARLTGVLHESVHWRAGLAYERVADGDAESDVIASGTRASLDVPTLEGNTGIMEVAITVRPKETSPWAVDFGLKGYVGDRQGVSGNASVVYSF